MVPVDNSFASGVINIKSISGIPALGCSGIDKSCAMISSVLDSSIDNKALLIPALAFCS